MFKQTLLAGTCLGLLFTSSSLSAHEKHNHSKQSASVPAGIMGAHLHKEGEFMVSYKYEHQRYSGVRNGSDTVSSKSVLATYGEVPTKMEMGMHMFEFMYGVSDKLTLMVMPEFMKMDMTHLAHGNHGAHSHKIEGMGDTDVMGLYSLRNQGNQNFILNFGLSLPTGSFDKTFINHHDRTYILPYNMQFGSGTYDPILGVTYTEHSGEWSWGAQNINYIRFGKNDEGYRLGNRYIANAWVSNRISEIAAVSLRLEGQAWDNVSGKSNRLPLTAIAGANPDENRGERVYANFGLNFFGNEILEGQGFQAEFGVPVYERYSGPAAESDYKLTLGWNYSF